MSSENKNLKTLFKYPGEMERYIRILNGERIDKSKKYKLDGLEFKPVKIRIEDCDYYGMHCEFLPNILYKYFEDYGLQGSYTYDDAIFGLEPLVLTHAIMMDYHLAYNNESIEECYNRVLDYSRKEMLEKVIDNMPQEFESDLTPFDKAVAVFLNKNFDTEDFLDKCIFNTSCYYDGRIDFSWYTKDKPEVVYSNDFYGYSGYCTRITFKNQGDRFYQEARHIRNTNGEDTLMYLFNPNVCLSLNTGTNKIKGAIDHSPYLSRKVKEDNIDIDKMNAILDSFIDKDLSFDEVKRLKKEYYGK